MTSIFISYSRRDKAIAEVIAAELRNRGAEVFIDYQELVAGENFIGRLGREIEKRDCVVFLVSPRSVESKWVQAEIAWAFTKGKPVIPVLIEPATMVDFFFLINVEQVDFTRWSLDGNVHDAIQKLAKALNLSDEPISVQLLPETTLPVLEDAGEPYDELVPKFARDDLLDMFTTAGEVADADPEQAIFLYQQILAIDQDFAEGMATTFIQREQKRLEPLRQLRLMERANNAVRAGQWHWAIQLAEDVLTIDPTNVKMKFLIQRCKSCKECSFVYQQAVNAVKKNKVTAAINYLRYVRETCPDYGDPSRLYQITEIRNHFVISSSTVSSLVPLHRITISGKNGSELAVITFSPDGNQFACGNFYSNVTLFETASFTEIASLESSSLGILSVAFSPDGALLATGNRDNTVRIWDTATHRERLCLTGHSDLVCGVSFSPHQTIVASSSHDGTIRAWNLANGKLQQLIKTPFNWHKFAASLQNETVSAYEIVFSPDGKQVACSFQDGFVHLWDTVTFQKIWTYTERAGRIVGSISYSPNGKMLAASFFGNTVSLLDVVSFKLLDALGPFADFADSLAFSPNGELLAIGLRDRTLKIWNVADRTEMFALPNLKSSIYSLAFSPDGTLLASGDMDGAITLWGILS